MRNRLLAPWQTGLVSALLLPPLGGCSAGAMDASPVGAGGQDAAVVLRGGFQRDLLLTGELAAVRSTSIKSPQTALFQMRIQFMAEEGAVVRQGESLLDFDNSSLAAQMRELETSILDAETQIVSKRNELATALKDLEIELAEKQYEYERSKLEASVDPEIMSRKTYSERQLAYSKATSELKETHERIALTRERGQAELDVLIINRDKLRKDLLSTQNDLDLLSIKAPSDGLVVYEKRPNSTLRFQEGDSCWPGQGVLRLPDLSEMQVDLSVNEVDAPWLHVGVPVRFTLDSFPGREILGEITHVPSMAVKSDEESKIRIFKVIASLSETWAGEMKPGMSVLGTVVVDRREDAPLVARSAVRFDGVHYWVRAGRDGEPDRRINPISRNASFYLIPEEDYAYLTEKGQ